MYNYDAKIYSYEEVIRLSRIFRYPLIISHALILDKRKIISTYTELIGYVSKIDHISPEQPLLLSLK